MTINELNTNNNNTRNYGIDLLRIYSMFLIVILHILGHGGTLDASTGINNNILLIVNIGACCAVDTYALISGYVGYSEKNEALRFNTSKFISIWIEVVCYSLGITLCALIFKVESIGVNEIIRAIFPVASNQYWYFSCYVLLLFAKPWINRLIQALDDKSLDKFVISIVSVTSVYMMFVEKLGEKDPFHINVGFSSIWLICLYIIGAWIRRRNIIDKVSQKVAIGGVLGCIVLTYLGMTLPGLLNIWCLGYYTSPTVVIMAASYLIIFGKFKLNSKAMKVISFFSPAAFGVYLIHDNPIVREHYITDAFLWIAESTVGIMVLEVIGCGLAVLIICLCIEKIRLTIFKYLRINNLINSIGNKIDKQIDNLFNKIDYSEK